jgi:hypothetical protein
MPRSEDPSGKEDGNADPSRTDYQFLESTSRNRHSVAVADSPIHWRRPQDQGPAKRVNDCLVKLFERLLKNAESLKILDDPERVKKDIEREINREIWGGAFQELMGLIPF